MSFIKQFTFDIPNGLKLDDTTKRDEYIRFRINHFSEYSNYSNKEELLKLLNEISDMCDYDKATAKFDFSNISTVVGFNQSGKKDEMIYFYNLVIILGGVFLNVFDLPKNRLHHTEDGISGPICTSQMIVRAYNELVLCKNKEGLPAAYGATLIFATLFEKELKAHVKIHYAKKFLNELLLKKQQGQVTLTEDELNLFDFLQFNYEMIPNRTTNTVFDGVNATTVMLYDLLYKYGVIKKSDKDIKLMFLNKLTLTSFIRSSLFKNISDTRFVKIVEILFDSDYLNLRNNLAHCNFTYTNYYSLNLTALLHILLFMVSNEFYLV